MRFTVYADAAYIANELFTGYAGETPNELTGWISVQHPAVTLAPGASALGHDHDQGAGRRDPG